jgi:hypothetical protein
MVFQLSGFFAPSNNLVLLPHIDTKEKFLPDREQSSGFAGCSGPTLARKMWRPRLKPTKFPACTAICARDRSSWLCLQIEKVESWVMQDTYVWASGT